MQRIERVIVRTPSDSFPEGLTHGLLGKPDPALAKKQHQRYVAAIESDGIPITVLPELIEFPDSCFVEDTAIVTDRVAILTNPRFRLRNGEPAKIEATIRSIYGDRIERIDSTVTLEGGDVSRVEDHFFIGQSSRTTQEGAEQLGRILTKYGFTYDIVPIAQIKGLLHLTTGSTYLGERTVLGIAPILADPAFESYRRLVVPEGEEYAANCIRLNNFVLFPEGFPKTEKMVRDAGFEVKTINVSEIERQDGGLSCLSLRVPPLMF